MGFKPGLVMFPFMPYAPWMVKLVATPLLVGYVNPDPCLNTADLVAVLFPATIRILMIR